VNEEADRKLQRLEAGLALLRREQGELMKA